MAEKKQAASGWPISRGDFISGDAKSCVAVVTMGSHLDEKGLCDAGAAIRGSCKTENLGSRRSSQTSSPTPISASSSPAEPR